VWRKKTAPSTVCAGVLGVLGVCVSIVPCAVCGVLLGVVFSCVATQGTYAARGAAIDQYHTPGANRAVWCRFLRLGVVLGVCVATQYSTRSGVIWIGCWVWLGVAGCVGCARCRSAPRAPYRMHWVCDNTSNKDPDPVVPVCCRIDYPNPDAI